VHALLRKGRATGLLSAGLYILLGLVFLAWGFASEGLQFSKLLGALLTLYGIIILVRALAAPKFDGDEKTT